MKTTEVLTTLILSLTLISCSNFSSELSQNEVAASSTPAQTGYRALPSFELHKLLRNAVSEDNPIRVRTLLENHVPLSQNSNETSQQEVYYFSTGTSIPSSQDKLDINIAVSDQGALLHWAAYNGHSDLVPVLLIRGAYIDLKYGYLAKTPLMQATIKGHDAVIALLLNALATQPERIHSLIMMQDSRGWTALHCAAIYGHEAVVAQFLNALANYPEHMHSLIATKGNDGSTALHDAASNGHEAIVAQLLNALVTSPERIYVLIMTRDRNGWTALHRAASNGHKAIVVLLLNALSTHPERMHSLIMIQDNDRQTAFHCADQGGHKAIFAQLVNALFTHPERI